MRTPSTQKQDPRAERSRQINVRVDPAFYQALETLARRERRSISQAARQLLEDGLRQRLGSRVIEDDTSGQEIAILAAAGGAFDWLAAESDIYDDTCGEPL
jgi:hypothetical protein